ncbi:S8 family serine peptidase [Aestuariivivens sediminicola]|uniref:S8 family serine peptidase n=1 Tax=Aestuariivivens sediminicola TaxID=2913560 RepID=UPI001F5A5962|nr:S8 family serine peptidase [Aestuariivivens sediminicola]
MKLLLTTLLLFIFSTVCGQTDLEKQKIISSYDIDKLANLKSNLAQKYEANKAIIEDYVKRNGLQKKVRTPDGQIKEIKYIIDNKPIYITTDNVNAAISTKTDKLHNGGDLGLNLEGQNMNIAIWDGGRVRLTHQEFLNSDSSASRASKGETLITIVDDHATHVAGTMVAKGTDPNAKGMAPQAALTSYDWTNDESEVIGEITNNALLLSNHSYGISGYSGNTLTVSSWYPGCYEVDAINWDQIAYDAPYYLMVTSAGNNGSDLKDYTDQLLAGYDKLMGNKNAKNNLVVASAKPLVFPGGNILIQEDAFSSQGPSDDGRIKPDITANGNLSYSSIGTSDTAYGNFGGTSMATPNTSGTLLLLQQYYNELNSKFMKAATLKGLACHTATDDTFSIGPDPELGWGFLNAETATQTITDDFNGSALIMENNLPNGSTYSYSFSTTGTGTLSATICWTDPPGPSQSGILNSTTPVLVNDLDLRLTAPDGTTVFLPWKLQLSDVSAPAIKGDNIVDNIENILVDNPVSGTYTLTVSHKGTLNPSQDFSLILTGFNLTLSDQTDLKPTELTIWPNPTTDLLNISYKSINNSKVNISLTDMQGRLVHSNTIIPSGTVLERIDTRIFAKGIYILSIKQANSIINKKVVLD